VLLTDPDSAVSDTTMEKKKPATLPDDGTAGANFQSEPLRPIYLMEAHRH
jgi:hypothetical protein